MAAYQPKDQSGVVIDCPKCHFTHWEWGRVSEPALFAGRLGDGRGGGFERGKGGGAGGCAGEEEIVGETE